MSSYELTICSYVLTVPARYMAPEILQGEQYTFVCDMWSLGVLMYVLLVRCLPHKLQFSEH